MLKKISYQPHDQYTRIIIRNGVAVGAVHKPPAELQKDFGNVIALEMVRRGETQIDLGAILAAILKRV